MSNFTILQMTITIIYIVADGENLSEHTANFLKLTHQRWTDFLSSVHHSLVESVLRLVCTRDIYTAHLLTHMEKFSVQTDISVLEV